ncbi:MAG: cadherin-like beta sandwich domain-containing protein [Bacilli bacterium]|nr:cadherin-like beta sandwich domain-containing protein [Bacilli bacterium]
MKKRFLKGITLFLLMVIALPINAKAAIKFSVSKSADNLKPGTQFNVSIKGTGIDSSNSISSYNLNLEFDSTKLEYISGGNSISGNVINLTGQGNPNFTSDFDVATISFKVSGGANQGQAPLVLKGKFKLGDGEEIDCKNNCNSSQVTVMSFGTDSSLSSLEIPNATLSPSFSSAQTNYSATIQDITSIKINAVPTDKNANVSISENAKSLQKGDNDVNVVVTSEDGQSKTTYLVKVTLKLTPTEEELLKANALLKGLKIKNQKIEFDQNEKKYYLTVPYKVKSLDITATPVNAKAKVEIQGYKKLYVGKNTIKIVITSEDKTKVENYQIIVTREDEKKEIVQTCPDEVSSREWIIFTVSMLFTFTLGIVLGYIVCKKDIIEKVFKKKKNKEEPVMVETLSDTVDLSGTIKEVNNKKKKQD